MRKEVVDTPRNGSYLAKLFTGERHWTKPSPVSCNNRSIKQIVPQDLIQQAEQV